MNKKINNEILLKQLAVIIAEYPRYTMKELSESVGISKASLHRIYGTREGLQELLIAETRQCIESIIAIIEREYLDYGKALEELIQTHFENKEFLTFAQEMQVCERFEYIDRYLSVMDDFFLKGKKQGFFKVEFDPSTITELFISTFSGITDAERRGRIASSLSRKIFKNAFLSGTADN